MFKEKAIIYRLSPVIFGKFFMGIALILFLFGGAAFGEHRARYISDNLEAEEARVALLLNAKESIEATYYIFNPDDSGYREIALLVNAARNGVNVSLYIDALGNSLSRAMIEYLQEEGVDVRIFNSLRYPSKLNNRSHIKLLIIDREFLLTGDRNIKKTYFENAPSRTISGDVLYKGPEAEKGSRYFQKIFNSENVTKPIPIIFKYLKITSQIIIEKEIEELHRVYPGPNILLKKVLVKMKKVEDVRVVASYFGDEDLKIDKNKTILEKISRAKIEVLIKTPYVVPTKELLTAFKTATIEGKAKVRLYTNSLLKTDVPLTYYAFSEVKDFLLKMGVKIFEHKGGGWIHAKIISIDHRYSYIGSYNLNHRSQYKDLEFGLWVKDRKFNRIISNDIYHAKSTSFVVRPKRNHRKATLKSCMKYILRLLITNPLRKSM